MALSKTSRYALAGLGGIIVLAAAAFLVAGPRILDAVLAEADAVSQKHTGLSLTFGVRPSFSLLPLGVSFQDARWGDASSPVSIAARSGHIAVAAGSLFGGVPKVSEIRLEGPVIRVRATPAGGAPAERSMTARDGGDASGAAALPVELDRMTVTDGAVVVERSDGGSLAISGLALTVDGLRNGGSCAVDAAFTAAMKQASGGDVEAGLTLKARMALSLPALRLDGLEAVLTPVRGLGPGLSGPVTLRAAGALALDAGAFSVGRCELAMAHFGAVLAGEGALRPDPAFAGSLTVEAAPSGMGISPSLAGIESASLSSRVRVGGGLLELDELAGAVNGTRIDGSLRAGIEPLLVQGKAHCATIDLNRLLAGVGSDDGTKEERPAAAEAAPGDGSAGGPAALPAVDFTLTADGILYRGVTIGDAAITLRGRDGRYELSPVRAAVDGGGC